jgi:hypothetical protein
LLKFQIDYFSRQINVILNMTNVKVTKLVPVTLNGKLKAVTVKVTKPLSPQPPFSKRGRGGIIALCFLLFALYSLLFAFPLQAKVSGFCSHCHTMHNSQGGRPMAKEYSSSYTNLIEDSTPNTDLLIADCIGCHFNNGTATIDNYGTPIVLNRNTPSKPLAGGNFYYVADGLGAEYNKGHNVLGISAQESPPPTGLGNTPPGGSALTDQLRCAGTYGCHGHNGRQTGDTAVEDQTQAIKGAHHGDDTPPLEGSLTNVARNYRFLLGIQGKEDTNWEKDNTNISHNEYKGTATPPSFTDNTTISFLCGECHGDFHSSTGVGSSTPWLRHPTDTILKSTGEYANYTIYSMVAPVARPYPDDITNPIVVTPGTDIIMCLSCHRAHASPYFKMMRWDYKNTNLSTALEGCNVCHTSKN